MKITNDAVKEFEQERRDAIAQYPNDAEWKDISAAWLSKAFRRKYMYNFSWLGRPIIQLPADMIAFQEIVWNVKPDLIIETGIAHGGSLILSASMLAMIDMAEASQNNSDINPKKSRRKVLGIDIDIRAHNRAQIEQHPFAPYIEMIEASSTADSTINAVKDFSKNFNTVLVCLDSNHVHDHVLKELEIYAPFVTRGSYCIVFDTIVEHLPDDMFPDRPWSHGNNPATAVMSYLEQIKQKPDIGYDQSPLFLEVKKALDNKLLLSANPGGFLRRV